MHPLYCLSPQIRSWECIPVALSFKEHSGKPRKEYISFWRFGLCKIPQNFQSYDTKFWRWDGSETISLRGSIDANASVTHANANGMASGFHGALGNVQFVTDDRKDTPVTWVGAGGAERRGEWGAVRPHDFFVWGASALAAHFLTNPT